MCKFSLASEVLATLPLERERGGLSSLCWFTVLYNGHERNCLQRLDSFPTCERAQSPNLQKHGGCIAHYQTTRLYSLTKTPPEVDS